MRCMCECRLTAFCLEDSSTPQRAKDPLVILELDHLADARRWHRDPAQGFVPRQACSGLKEALKKLLEAETPRFSEAQQEQTILSC